MVTNRSSLEMMLEKLEDQPAKDEPPPALPVRPASRARLPRARKPLLLDLQRRSNDRGLNGGVFESNWENREASQIKQMENSDEILEKGVASIQKWYRGHQVRCYYKDLRSGTLALQSFARGVHARKEYQFRRKRLRAIILIQKCTRKYIECRHITKNKTARNDRDQEQAADVKVPYSFVIDLHKGVLRTEAKVRKKKWENDALKIKLQEMDKKWLQHENRMKSMEIAWQDQLTYIQCLAAGKKNSGPIITSQFDSIQEHYDQNANYNVTRTPNGRSLDLVNTQIDKKLHPGEELRNLKVRFKAWKKEYRNNLREAQSTFKKLGNAETAGKSQRNNWWGRFSH